MEKIRWGILGCGKIAHKFANDLRLLPDATLAAVASRDATRAGAFASSYGVEHIFTSYESFVQSDVIDVVYVATPHGLHHEHTLLCLRHGKAVLCEKAFALNYRQAAEMIATARGENVFVMEAFWTRFLPPYQKMRELIAADAIGEVRWLQADFGFHAQPPLAQRLYDPALGGGSLLDIGIYPVFLALSLLGKPVDIRATMQPYSSGVDEQCTMSMTFANGAVAALSSTFAADTPVEAVIAGTKGRIHMKNRFHNAMATLELVTGRDHVQAVEVLREEGFGYQFEARHVGECLRRGLTESPMMTHADTLLLMETLDAIRKQCGIRYAVD